MHDPSLLPSTVSRDAPGGAGRPDYQSCDSTEGGSNAQQT